MNYINKKIYGLPKPLRAGNNTSPHRKDRIPYLHLVNVGTKDKSRLYWKVHIKRQGKDKKKYFAGDVKGKQDALNYLKFLELNPYF